MRILNFILSHICKQAHVYISFNTMAPKRKNDASFKEEDTRFQKLTDREHVLARPDMYCSSVSPSVGNYATIGESGKVVFKKIKIAPALIQIIEEPLMNATDRVSARHEPSSTISSRTTKISVEMDESSFSVMNDGDGVPCDFIEEYGIYTPELIFAHLRTSSNYDDGEQRLNAGRNGIGVKITNIFSKSMSIESIDNRKSVRYSQNFSENMSIIEKPKMSKFTGAPYTKVKFEVDGEKFGCKGTVFNKKIMDLIRIKIHEMSMCSLDNIKIKFNGQNVKTDSPEKYLQLYGVDKSNIVSFSTDRWKVAVAFTPENGGFRHHSFVNSTPTEQGGTHLNHVLDPILKALVEQLRKKFKLTRMRPSIVKDTLTIVVSAHVINPTFSSQTKDMLTLPVKEFGTSFEFQEKFVSKLMKMGLVEHIGDILKNKESSMLKDTDGKKTSVIKGIGKLCDAKFAGTKKSDKCYLIVTEGDSALTMALSATAVIGRDYFGAFPLRGKMLNVRDASPSSVSGNEEISNLKKIIGLQSGAHYDNTSKLRYGGIILLTDSDVDGIHIRGLLLNMFEVFWPSLLNMGFVHTLNTPIVRATRRSEVKLFYNEHEYKDWRSNNDEYKSFKIKYLKGLGSSTPSEAREYFKDVHNSIVKYVNDIQTSEMMSLAFDKKRAGDRKKWLMEYSEDDVLDTSSRKVGVSDFVNKELIHFSTSDMHRSIPSVSDGFKTSQRKSLCGSILKGIINSEAKVAQLSGFVADKMEYHHGEVSLCSTITGMAQNFTGSNNIEIFTPKGQLGSRLEGGKDAASPRYVFVQMNPISMKIFRREDEAVLRHLEEDGNIIEPDYYVPLIPMVLVNGSQGIGTGYSTSVPQYNPKDLIGNIRKRLSGKEVSKLVPYYRGFTGTITNSGDGTFESHGVYSVEGCKVIISELPVGTWSTPYKLYLSGLVDKKLIDSFEEKCTDTVVDFEVKMKEPVDMKLLKLSSTIRTSNMHLFDGTNRIRKYENTGEIEDEHFNLRKSLYEKRKNHQLKVFRHDFTVLTEKCRFFEYKIGGKIVIDNKKYEDIIGDLVKNDFKELGKDYLSTEKSFGYITDLKMFDIVKEKVEKMKLDVKNLGDSIDLLENTSVDEIWMSELDEIEKLL